MSRTWLIKAFTLVFALILAGCDLNPNDLPTHPVSLSFAPQIISFDDINYDEKLNRVIVPAAETGDLALIDPATGDSRLIQAFSRTTDPNNPVVGTTSAIVVHGMLFALDQNVLKLLIIDPATGKIVNSAPVEDTPDYVRYVSANNELWVTEKASSQIEVFNLTNGPPPAVKKSLAIAIPNGPEALAIDSARGLAFTSQPKIGTTAVINVLTHSILYEWGNGCSKGRGMAIDEDRQLLFVACNEGKLVMMDINNGGQQISSQTYGAGLDFVAYNPRLKHIYLPSPTSQLLAVFEVVETPVATDTPGAAPGAPSPTPGPTPTPGVKITLQRIGTADTAVKARCVTFDNNNTIWVCDPTHGQMFAIPDTYPPGN